MNVIVEFQSVAEFFKIAGHACAVIGLIGLAALAFMIWAAFFTEEEEAEEDGVCSDGGGI